MRFNDLETTEGDVGTLMKIYKICIQSYQTHCALHVLCKAPGSPYRSLRLEIEPSANGEIGARVTGSSRVNINSGAWPKERRMTFVGELFKCLVLREKYFPRMHEILTRTRCRTASQVRYDTLNNAVVVAFTDTIEIWSLRRFVRSSTMRGRSQGLCKRYEVGCPCSIASVEPMVRHRVGKDGAEYRIALRLSDWTVLDLYDPDIRETNGEFSLRVIYRVEGDRGNLNPTYGIRYLPEYVSTFMRSRGCRTFCCIRSLARRSECAQCGAGHRGR